MTLTEFLEQRIADDEVAMQGRDDRDWHEFRCDINRLHPDTKVPYPCDCGAPTRVLAECEAKRQILELHSASYRDWCAGCGFISDGEPMNSVEECPTLHALALPFTDHPDYRPEWAPTGRTI